MHIAKNYKYLLWDIDGTILDFKAAEKAAIRRLFGEFGLGICTDEMIARYSQINDRYWKALERGEMTKPEILTSRFLEFFQTEGISGDKTADNPDSGKTDRQLAEAFNAAYQPALGDTIVFCEKAREILEAQRAEHCLIAVTNGTRTAQEKKLANAGLTSVFHHIYISDIIGAEKPSREFFDHVFRDAGIHDPAQALIIGDSLTSDIRGAENAGIDSCWYNPGQQSNTTAIHATYEIHSLSEL